jgi:hypothetical protein
MPMDHISNESMRSYLLGKLSDDEAAALEEEYFTNRDYFLKVQAEEKTLIADYLDGKLPSADKHYFESRYLQVPLLQRKVEEVRRQRSAPRPATQLSARISWRVALAFASILLLGFGLSVYRSYWSKPPELVARNQPPQAPSALTIRIRPGSVKGPSSTTAQFEPPSGGSAVNLILELPGQASPIRYRVRISMVDSNGRLAPVWDSPEALVSSKSGKDQVLTLQMGGSLLRPGDYVAEARTPDGTVRETYVYRIK